MTQAQAGPSTTTRHPLEPLTGSEVEATIEIVKADARSTAGNECYVAIESEGVTVEHVETSSELERIHRRWTIAADY